MPALPTTMDPRLNMYQFTMCCDLQLRHLFLVSFERGVSLEDLSITTSFISNTRAKEILIFA